MDESAVLKIFRPGGPISSINAELTRNRLERIWGERRYGNSKGIDAALPATSPDSMKLVRSLRFDFHHRQYGQSVTSLVCIF